MTPSDHLDKSQFPWWFNNHQRGNIYVFTVARSAMPQMQADLRRPEWAVLRAASPEDLATHLVGLMNSLGAWTAKDVHHAFVLLMLLALHDRSMRSKLRTAPGGVITLQEDGRLQVGMLTRAGLKDAYALLDDDRVTATVTNLRETIDA